MSWEQKVVQVQSYDMLIWYSQLQGTVCSLWRVIYCLTLFLLDESIIRTSFYGDCKLKAKELQKFILDAIVIQKKNLETVACFDALMHCYFFPNPAGPQFYCIAVFLDAFVVVGNTFSFISFLKLLGQKTHFISFPCKVCEKNQSICHFCIEIIICKQTIFTFIYFSIIYIIIVNG